MMPPRYAANGPTLAVWHHTRNGVLDLSRKPYRAVDVYNRGGWWERVTDTAELEHPRFDIQPMEKEAARAWLKGES